MRSIGRTEGTADLEEEWKVDGKEGREGGREGERRESTGDDSGVEILEEAEEEPGGREAPEVRRQRR